MLLDRPKTISIREILIPALVLFLIIFVLLTLRFWRSHNALPEGLIQTNGRLEGEQITVSTRYPGRIARMLVKEGDSVTAGQLLAVVEDAEAEARADQARHGAATIDAQLKAAQTSLLLLQKEVPLAIQTAAAQLKQSEALLLKARATEEQSKREAERMRNLAADGTVDPQRSEQAQLTWTAAQRDLDSAENARVQATKQLESANLGPDRIAQKKDEVAALEAQLLQSQATQNQAESILADLKIYAPSKGVITTRLHELGEVLAAGSPIFDLVDLDQLYLKAYIPEAQIGKIHLNLPAQIYTDAYPDQPCAATVRYISSRAEFTPKEVQTPEERTKLVYAVKIYLNANPDHRMTPGMPADAVIRWKEGVPWMKPVW